MCALNYTLLPPFFLFFFFLLSAYVRLQGERRREKTNEQCVCTITSSGSYLDFFATSWAAVASTLRRCASMYEYMT